MMLSLKTKIKHIIVKKLIMFMILSKQATGNPQVTFLTKEPLCFIVQHGATNYWFRFIFMQLH